MIALTDFLFARIAEDEWEAKPFVNGLGEAAHWTCDEVGGVVREGRAGQPIARAELHLYGVHMARHDPARVLAECEAKRRIVAEHERVYRARADAYDPDRGPLDQSATYQGWFQRQAQMTVVLELLALPYADHHPDYRDSWRR